MTEHQTKAVFRPRARMLLLLGDQLIRDAGVAVFELVKNAYDADASECVVTMLNIHDARKGEIVVQDDGTGMDLDAVTRVWLEPGTEHRAEQRATGRRTKRHLRLPLGEKGVGRFAAHKLGEHVTLISRAKGADEIVVTIDWADFAAGRYLSDIPVRIHTRSPEVYKGARTGTRLEIRKLREDWSRGKVRHLQRAISSICSPFGGPEGFRARLVLEPQSDWLDKLLDIADVLELSLFRVHGRIAGDSLTYDYSFVPLPAMKGRITDRVRKGVEAKLMRFLPPKGHLDLSRWKIGEVYFDFRVFDREPAVLELSTSDKDGLKRFLDQNGGVWVYRDRVRVYDFGEPGNDWLGMDARRVNIPTRRISRNVILGAVSLDAATSTDLIEKTNREGFIENDAYEDFQQAILNALMHTEAERQPDKDRLRQLYSRRKQREPVLDEISELRGEVEKRGLARELGGYLDRIERQFSDVRERLLTAAGPGLTLTVVVHEVEKIVKELLAALKKGVDRTRITSLVQHLAEMIDGLAYLARKSGSSKEKASVLIRQSVFNTEYRLAAHGIDTIHGLDARCKDFTVDCSRRLIVATLMNLIDNSIYWLEYKAAKPKRLYIGMTLDLEGGPAIVVADSGTGFADPPEYLVEPFFSRKPDGMGLGLHIANEVMKIHKGRLLFPDASEISLPKGLNGAVVAIQFPEAGCRI